MKVSKKIKDLVSLALEDRILTNVEKQTIIDAAVAEGNTVEDITAFLDNAIKQRLQSYTKEELTRCPHCGAQIPLISDNCIFCGESLNASNKEKRHINRSGKSFDIIRNENIKTETERRNAKQCPNCGAPFPLLGNVCTSCGHILHESTSSDYNINNLIQKLDENMRGIKSYPSFFLWFLLLIIRCLPTIFIIAIVLEELRVPMPFKISDLIPSSIDDDFLVILIVIAAFMELTVYNHMPRFIDQKFNEALHGAKKNINKIKSLYGINKDSETITSNAETEISTVVKRHRIQLVASIVLLISVPIVLVRYQYNKQYINYVNEHKNDSTCVKLSTVKPIKFKTSGHVFADSYLKVENDAVIWLEPIFDRIGSGTKYCLRIDNLKIVTTGQPWKYPSQEVMERNGSNMQNYKFKTKYYHYDKIEVVGAGKIIFKLKDYNQEFDSFIHEMETNASNPYNCYYASFCTSPYMNIDDAINDLKRINTIRIHAPLKLR